MKPLKTIKSLGNLKNKKILLRVDLNSDVVKGKVLESDRIKAHAETIKTLKSKGAEVVVISHQGSPGKKDFIGLKKHSKLLNKYVKVKFVKDIMGKKAIKAIRKLKPGKALLLENIRFEKDEFQTGKNRLVKNLSPWFDFYINDAFSVCHRDQTSITGFPKYISHAAGPVLMNELKNLKKLKSKMNNSLFVLGGKKPDDLMPLLKHRILSTGKLCLLVLMAHGYKFGKEDELMKKEKKLLPKIKKHLKNIQAPVDLAINSKGRKEISIEDLPVNSAVLDIGSDTIEEYKEEIMGLGKNRAVFFKGSAGMFEKKGFNKGTKEILGTIANSKAFSVIAGGQGSDALNKFKIDKKKFGYVSLSGGALVKYLAGEKLPGLEVLK